MFAAKNMSSIKRPKIFFDASSLRYLHTGLGQFSYNLLKEFAFIAPTDLEIVALVHPDYRSLVPEGMDILLSGFFRRHSPPAFQEFLYPRCDVWHVTNENTRLAGIPAAPQMLLTVHGLHFLDEEDKDSASMMLKKVQRLVDRANLITTVSEYTRKLVASKLETGSKEVRVIHNGIAVSGVKASIPSWAPHGKFIYAVGTFFVRKNFDVLVPMMRHLPDLTLVLAGKNSTDYGGHMRNLIADAGLTERILMPGEISEEEKIWLYENGDAMVFPSFSEGFGIPVIECLSFGKLVICSRHGSLPEVGGSYASYWDDFDPVTMAELLKANLAGESPAKGPARMNYAGKFTWRNSANVFLDTYRRLVAAGQRT